MIKTFISIDKNLTFFTHKKYGTGTIVLVFEQKRSVKDLLESIGIPHVEIGSVTVNGVPVLLENIIEASCNLVVRSPAPAQSFLPQNEGTSLPQFLLDVHLGKLAVNLRMLGLDADYSNDRDDALLSELSAGYSLSSGRILLSCDRGLMMRKNVTAGMLIRSRQPVEQAVEVLQRFGLSEKLKPFSRCFNCGGILERAGRLSDLTAVEQGRIPARVAGWCQEFTRCSVCGQIYWEGSHFKKMREKVDLILQRSRQKPEPGLGFSKSHCF